MASVYQNVAELHASVGGVPLDRIRLIPHPGEATLSDAIEADAEVGARTVELVDGVLIEKAMGYQESLLATTLAFLIKSYLQESDLGVVAGSDGTSQYYEDCTRAPDVSFVSWQSLPGGRVPADPIPDLAPDLAVEVLSTSNTDAEMQRKVADFKRGGVRVIWLLDPRAETATVYVGDADPVTVDAGAVLDAGDVLPGFEVTLAELIEKAGLRRGDK